MLKRFLLWLVLIAAIVLVWNFVMNFQARQ